MNLALGRFVGTIVCGVGMASACLIMGLALNSLSRTPSNWDLRIDRSFSDEINRENGSFWTTRAHSDTLRSLWLFFVPQGNRPVEREFIVEVLDGASGVRLGYGRAIQSVDSAPQPYARIDFEETVRLDRGQWIRLSIQVPRSEPGQGIKLVVIEDPLLEDRVEFGKTVRDNSALEYMWHSSTDRFPVLPFSLAIVAFLVVWCFGNGYGRRAALVATGTVVVMTVGFYYREARVWGLFAHYWADGYVSMSRDWLRYFLGEWSGRQLFESLNDWRNGQVPLFPLLIGGLRFLGLSPLFAYSLVVTSCIAGTLAILGRLSERVFEGNINAYPLGMAIGLGNPLIYLSAGNLQTDAGGIAFAALSIYLTIRMVEASGRVIWLYSLGCGVAIAGGCFTRLALLPLAFVPVAVLLLGVLLKQVERDRGGALAASSLIGCSLALGFWWWADLFGTIEEARAFSALEGFRRHFSLEAFGRLTVLSLGASFVWIVIGIRFWRDRRLWVVVIGVIGLLGLLAVGQIIPWYRYWAPVAMVAAMGGPIVFSNFSRGVMAFGWFALANCAYGVCTMIYSQVLKQL